MDLLKRFEIPEAKRDRAILSLTHRSMMSYNNSIDTKLLDYYLTMGKSMTKVALMRVIACKYSMDINVVNTAAMSSRYDSIIKLYDRLGLDKYVIVNERSGLTEELFASTIVYQFFGFLCSEISYEKAYEIFNLNYSVSDILIEVLSMMN